ncbi:MAG: hypothetical protein ACC655_02625 [Rhodothermia bacterium]
MTDSVVPTFHRAFLEYGSVYDEPALEKWDAGKLSQALLRSLGQWGVSLEDISVSQSAANAAEVHTRIELFSRKVVLEVGIGQLRFSADDPDWGNAETLVEVVEKTLSGVRSVLGVSIDRHWATLAFHFSVQGREPGELTKAFLNPVSELLDEPGVRSFGVSVYREDGHFVLDTSVMYPNALFMRILREFPGDVSFRKVGETIYEEEARYLRMLGLEVG